MKKTILTLVMMLTMALAIPSANAAPVSKAESVIDASMKGVERVKEKIDEALDDTITTSDGATVEIDGHKGELSPDDIKEISNQWVSVAKQMFISGSFCLLGLVALVLCFRYLTRRRKYAVIEKAIINNYPLNDLAMSEAKRTAIYVPQPVYPAAAPAGSAQRPVAVTSMPNWRALMPAVKWIAWGTLFVLFSIAACDGGEDPFWPIGLVLILVGVCKGFILYKEQKALQEAWNLNVSRQQQEEPMREGIPVPPPMDNDYKEDDTYQPY